MKLLVLLVLLALAAQTVRAGVSPRFMELRTETGGGRPASHSICLSWGDTHIHPFGGKHRYDIMSEKPFVLTQYQSEDKNKKTQFSVQATQANWGSARVTVDQWVAIKCGSDVVTFTWKHKVNAKSPTVKVNGVDRTAAILADKIHFPSAPSKTNWHVGPMAQNNGRRFVVPFNCNYDNAAQAPDYAHGLKGELVFVWFNKLINNVPGYSNVRVETRQTYAGKLTGACGNYDNNPGSTATSYFIDPAASAFHKTPEHHAKLVKSGERKVPTPQALAPLIYQCHKTLEAKTGISMNKVDKLFKRLDYNIEVEISRILRDCGIDLYYKLPAKNDIAEEACGWLHEVKKEVDEEIDFLMHHFHDCNLDPQKLKPLYEEDMYLSSFCRPAGAGAAQMKPLPVVPDKCKPQVDKVVNEVKEHGHAEESSLAAQTGEASKAAVGEESGEESGKAAKAEASEAAAEHGGQKKNLGHLVAEPENGAPIGAAVVHSGEQGGEQAGEQGGEQAGENSEMTSEEASEAADLAKLEQYKRAQEMKCEFPEKNRPKLPEGNSWVKWPKHLNDKWRKECLKKKAALMAQLHPEAAAAEHSGEHAKKEHGDEHAKKEHGGEASGHGEESSGEEGSEEEGSEEGESSGEEGSEEGSEESGAPKTKSEAAEDAEDAAAAGVDKVKSEATKPKHTKKKNKKKAKEHAGEHAGEHAHKQKKVEHAAKQGGAAHVTIKRHEESSEESSRKMVMATVIDSNEELPRYRPKSRLINEKPKPQQKHAEAKKKEDADAKKKQDAAAAYQQPQVVHLGYAPMHVTGKASSSGSAGGGNKCCKKCDCSKSSEESSEESSGEESSSGGSEASAAKESSGAAKSAEASKSEAAEASKPAK